MDTEGSEGVSPGQRDSEPSHRCPQAETPPPGGTAAPGGGAEKISVETGEQKNVSNEEPGTGAAGNTADLSTEPRGEPADDATSEQTVEPSKELPSSSPIVCMAEPTSEAMSEPSAEPTTCTSEPETEPQSKPTMELPSEPSRCSLPQSSEEPSVGCKNEPLSELAAHHPSQTKTEPLSKTASEQSGEPVVEPSEESPEESARESSATAPAVGVTEQETLDSEDVSVAADSTNVKDDKDPDTGNRATRKIDQDLSDKSPSPKQSGEQVSDATACTEDRQSSVERSDAGSESSKSDEDATVLPKLTNAAPKHPSSLAVSSPGGSTVTLSSGENSRASSSNISPMASPSRTSMGLLEANQITDAQNAQTLQDIQGDIQCVISQSLAMFSHENPSGDGQQPPLVAAEQAVTVAASPHSRSSSIPISTTLNSVEEAHSEKSSRVEQTSKQSQKTPEAALVNGQQSNNASSNKPADGPVSDLDESDQLLSELDAELTEPHDLPAENETAGESLCIETPNGVRQKIRLSDLSEVKLMKTKYELLSKQQNELKAEMTRLKVTNENQEFKMAVLQSERDDFHKKLQQQQVGSETENIYQAQIKELEMTISEQEQEVKQSREKLEMHDNAAKRAVATLQNELKSQVDRVKKMYEECRREKEGMTMKYAQAEQKNIELQQKQSRLDLQMKDMLRERETVIARFKGMKADKLKIQEMFEGRAAEFGALRREIEKHKETIQAADMKVKWHQNKLKAESEQHKESKLKVEDLMRKLKEAKEETEMIRRDCQAMVKTYQESDDIKSNSLGKELRQKEEKLQQQLQEKSDHLEVHETVKKELDTLKRIHKDTIEELKTMKDRVTCLEAERITQEHTLDRFRETLQTQKHDNKELKDKVIRLDTMEQEMDKVRENTRILENRLEELQHTNKDLNIEIEGSGKRETEHLVFSQKVSDKNAQLHSENSSLNTKLIGVTAEQERLQTLCAQLEKKVASLEKDLAQEKKLRESEVTELAGALHTKSRAVEELSRQVEEEKDENRTMKRKHTANLKDLTRQLHQTRKKLDALEQNKTPGERDSLSVGSRTSSNGSLDTLGTSGNPVPLSRASSHDTTPHPQEEAPPVVEVIEVDKQMLVEKIVRLQKAHARKNEKMEFMEDHINQLVTDIQRKAKIIQNYVMRDESGSLAPESVDRHKVRAQLAKKGGIMASLYNSHSEDSAMNLDLSLEINHKLQSVLEDTLLKNITLKDNLETLGEEIARISQDNRKLQLHLQSQKSKGTS